MDEETRRELDRIWSTVTRMDEHGTRGVVALQVQLTELIKDLSEFKVDINNRLMRTAQARRWLIGLVVGMVGMIGGLISVAVQLAEMKGH